ncbi:MAG: hypothetical protein KDK89_00780 [Alphaproteobacteria bacterium]|nr:hypothetical protein [Alphaproteobacteria bacterium]
MARAGDLSQAVVFAGEELDLTNDIVLAGDMLQRIVAGVEALLRGPAHIVVQ